MPDTASEPLRAIFRRPRASTASLGARRRRLPKWTLRLRLTLLYGALLLAAGAVLLAIVYGLVARSVPGAGKESVFVSRATGGLPPPARASELRQFPALVLQGPGKASATVQLQTYAGRVKSAATRTIRRLTSAQRFQIRQLAAKASTQINHQRQATLDALLTKSGIALGIMAIVSIGLGWLMAGRALRPVRTMGIRARGISERNLHERLALAGPDDELKELGDTFDGLLARLETAFESQRRFVANASHELRTPITVERTLVEVALADPNASVESLRRTCERVLAAGEQQERLIEALLTLARSQRGLQTREDLDLAAVTGGVLHGVTANGARLRSSLSQARTNGDPALVERLVSNLVDNALHHNVKSGWVRAWTGVHDGAPTLRVTNTGPVIPAEQATVLIEPFRRLDGERTGRPRGSGLGLSIVDAIASAHGAQLRAHPRDGGGLDVEVRFPAS